MKIVTDKEQGSSYGIAVKKGENAELLEMLNAGLANLYKHIENMKAFGFPVVVAINRFITDTPAELARVKEACAEIGATAVPCDIWAQGGAGGKELAETVKAVMDKTEPTTPVFTYDDADPIAVKIEKITTKIYGAKDVVFTPAAKKQLATLQDSKYATLPICVAKTQYSLSDDAKKLGRPEGFTLTVRELQLRAGAGFIVAVSGDIMLMPGLPRVPNTVGMKIDSDGTITGLS